MIQSELARLESATTAAESEAVHTSDEFHWESRNDADSEDAEGSSAVECFDSCGIGVSLQNS